MQIGPQTSTPTTSFQNVHPVGTRMTAPSNAQATAIPSGSGGPVEGPWPPVILQVAHKDPTPSPLSSTDEDCKLSEFTGTPSQASQFSESSKENENPHESKKTPKNI